MPDCTATRAHACHPACTLYVLVSPSSRRSPPGFHARALQLNREMVSANARITQRHPWETTWSEWPLNLRGVLYFSRDTGLGYHQLIYLLGTCALHVCARTLTRLPRAGARRCVPSPRVVQSCTTAVCRTPNAATPRAALRVHAVCTMLPWCRQPHCAVAGPCVHHRLARPHRCVCAVGFHK
ncbi:hypothetical protein EON67_10360 [archaeon]|nr:MAG: hypothetical protein EON67_10360 [archaeon]